MNHESYINNADREEYRRFVEHHLGSYGRECPDEVWHYTTAEGLIEILKTGMIFSTQISCLNDNLEQRYFGDLCNLAIKQQLIKRENDPFRIVLEMADQMLEKRDFTSYPAFVACFSEVEDDLGQWRGYGGGECGYAIGFNVEDLLSFSERNICFFPMNYDETVQNSVVNDILRMAEIYFIKGIEDKNIKEENYIKWASEFLETFDNELWIFSSLTKHSKFSSERERRIVTHFQESDRTNLEFRQKRTLLARHLPLDLTINGRLPITRIYIGPSSAKHISKISVGDLLLKYGYTNISIELTKVPYRIP